MNVKNSIGIIFLLFQCLLLSSCGVHQEEVEQLTDQGVGIVVYDLEQSTNIIIKLIKTGELSTVLAEHNKEAPDLMINNFSPSEMAFEAEVLSNQNPVLVLFYDSVSTSALAILEKCAELYKDTIKCVAVNAEQLFRVTQHSDVDSIPTFILINEREEIGRIEKLATFDELHELVRNYMKG